MLPSGSLYYSLVGWGRKDCCVITSEMEGWTRHGCGMWGRGSSQRSRYSGTSRCREVPYPVFSVWSASLANSCSSFKAEIRVGLCGEISLTLQAEGPAHSSLLTQPCHTGLLVPYASVSTTGLGGSEDRDCALLIFMSPGLSTGSGQNNKGWLKQVMQRIFPATVYLKKPTVS